MSKAIIAGWLFLSLPMMQWIPQNIAKGA